MRLTAIYSSRRAWATVALLWPVACLNYLDRLLITTLHDPLVNDIPMSEAQFGMLTTAFLWVYGFISPVGGFLADKLGRTPVIIGSLLTWSALTWATAHMHSYESLLAVRALMGISEACYIPAALALISDFHPAETRSRATGIHMSGVYAGAALGGIGGFIAEAWGWRSGFSIFGGFGIAYAALLFFLLRDKAKSSAEQIAFPHIQTTTAPNTQWSDLLKNNSLWILFCHVSLLAAAFWLCNGWLPVFLKENFSLGLGHAGISATGFVQTASFAGILIGGWWADRWFRTNRNARIFVPLIGFLIAAPAFAGMACTSVLGIAVFGMIIFGLARGFSDANLMPLVCQIVPDNRRATAYGILNLSGCLTGGLLIYAGGHLRDNGFNLSIAFLTAAGMMFVAACLLLLLRNKNTESRP